MIYQKSYPAPAIDEKQMLRYVGVPGADAELISLVRECVAEAMPKLSYNVCYGEFDLKIGEGVDLGFVKSGSKALSKNLFGCESAVVFAASVGVGIDRLISRYSAVSPTKALIFDGIGAERIESLCDAFCEDLAREKANGGYALRPRFSAGYGDLPLLLQKDIFSALDPSRRIGLSLSDSMVMSPSKSVTAIIGVYKR